MWSCWIKFKTWKLIICSENLRNFPLTKKEKLLFLLFCLARRRWREGVRLCGKLKKKINVGVKDTRATPNLNILCLIVRWLYPTFQGLSERFFYLRAPRGGNLMSRVTPLYGKKALKTVSQFNGKICRHSEWQLLPSLLKFSGEIFKENLKSDNIGLNSRENLKYIFKLGMGISLRSFSQKLFRFTNKHSKLIKVSRQSNQESLMNHNYDQIKGTIANMTPLL